MFSRSTHNSIGPPFSWTRESAFGRWFQNSNTWHQYVLAVAFDDFRSLLGKRPEPEHVLDLGCGHGLSFALIERMVRPRKITALDIDPAMLIAAHERAREVNCEISVSQGDARQINATNDSFDMIVCHQLLHHADDQHKVLAEMYRVLKPGGVALIGETCKVFINMLPIRVLFTHPSHSQRTASDYVAMVRSTGFEVPEDQLNRYTPWWSVPDLGLFDRLGWRRRTAEPTEVMMIAHKPPATDS